MCNQLHFIIISKYTGSIKCKTIELIQLLRQYTIAYSWQQHIVSVCSRDETDETLIEAYLCCVDSYKWNMNEINFTIVMVACAINENRECRNMFVLHRTIVHLERLVTPKVFANNESFKRLFRLFKLLQILGLK